MCIPYNVVMIAPVNSIDCQSDLLKNQTGMLFNQRIIKFSVFYFCFLPWRLLDVKTD